MSAKDLILTFLRTMEARDLDTAESMMADDAIIIFPGNKRFSSQREMVESAKGRYQWIKKTFDQIDCFTREDEAEIVIIIGTLYGMNNYNIDFEGIRYIDRFVVIDNKITEQHIWNDLAESSVLDQKQAK